MKVVGIIIFYVICSILDDIIMGNISFKDWKSEKNSDHCFVYKYFIWIS